MIQMINQFAEKWFSWQVSMLWQVGVLIILVACADFILRKWAWPQVRYALWLLILVKLVLPPALTSPASFTAEIPLFVKQTMENSEYAPKESSRTQKIEEIQNAKPEIRPSGKSELSNTEIQKTEEIASPMTYVRELGKPTVFMTPATGAGANNPMSWKVYLMGVWVIGIFVLSAWVIVRLRSLRKEHLKIKTELPVNLNRILESAARQLNLKIIPQISLSEKVCCPAVFGVFRPVMLLPREEFENISEQDAENMFLHELAHIKRGDLFVHAFYMCLQILYWFNPLLWVIRRHLQNLRELCCDATVARILREKTGAYRQTLLETAKRLIAEPADPGMGLLGLFENSGRLIDRLRWLEKKSWRYRPLRIATVFILICLMSACVLPMAKNKATEDKKTLATENTEATEIKKIKNADFIIKGKVTDTQTGKPIANAKVGDVNEYAKGKFFTITDANGNYSYKTYYEEHGLKASAQGYKEQRDTLLTKVFGKEKEKVINFKLSPISKKSEKEKIKIGGVVLNQDNKPISNVEVEIRWGVETCSMRMLDGNEVFTNEQGRWESLVPADIQDISLEFGHKDYVRKLLYNFKVSSLNENYIFKLTRGQKFTGQVVNEDVKPIDSAVLMPPESVTSIMADGGVAISPTMAQTDSNGNFTLSALSEGENKILVDAKGYAPKVITVDSNQEIKPQTIILGKGKVAAGIVQDVNGKPIEGVRIKGDHWRVPKVCNSNKQECWPWEQYTILRLETKSDANGYFAIENAPDSGVLEIYGGKKGNYLSYSQDVNLADDKLIEVTLYKPPVISGNVVDEQTGEPIKEFSLTEGLRWSDGNYPPSWLLTSRKINSSEGRFSASPEHFICGKDMPYGAVKIEAENYLPGVILQRVGEESVPVTVKLKKGTPVTGQIISPDGNPIENVEVTIADEQHEALIDGLSFGKDSIGVPEYFVKTSKAGEYKFPPIRGKAYIAAIHKTGWGIKEIDSNSASNKIVLTPWAKVKGQIKDFPNKNVYVMIWEESKGEIYNKRIHWGGNMPADLQGRFSFEYVPSLKMKLAFETIPERNRIETDIFMPEPGREYEVIIDGNKPIWKPQPKIYKAAPYEGFRSAPTENIKTTETEQKAILEKTLQTIKMRYNSGRASNAELLNAQMDLLRLSVKLAETPQQKITVLEQIISLMKEHEQATEKLVDAGRATQEDLNKIKLQRLDAEKELALMNNENVQAEKNNNQTSKDEVSKAAVLPENIQSMVENVPGKLVFQGRYRHHSRGKEIEIPSELWLKQDVNGGINALAYLPWRGSYDVANGDKNNRLISYNTATQAAEGKTSYLIELKFEDGKALLTRKGVREDRDNFPISVSRDGSFNPNSRPDSYCADNIFLRSLNLKPGEKKEFRVYDWDITGEQLVDYSIQITHAGKEHIVVPAGDFEANHYVLQQVSSADTWFKKRAGHVTDYWVLDNNIIVRVLRHREPYEMELLDYSYPKDLKKNLAAENKNEQTILATEAAETTEVKQKITYPIEFEITKDSFLEGDSIEITEIVGSADSFEPGQIYTIKGKYTLGSQDEAMLHIYATNGEIESEQGPVVRRGSGEFVRTFTYKKQGSLHLSFYPTNGGSGFGGIYFDQKDKKEKISDGNGKDADVYIEDFKIQPYQAGGLYELHAKIGNKGTAPQFRMRFYKGDPQDNLNLFGKPQSGSHGAGPIKPGEFWNESSQPFALNEGTTMFFVVLDFDNTVAESNENNNQAILAVDVNEGKITRKIIGQSVIISRFSDGHKSLDISNARMEERDGTTIMKSVKVSYDSGKGIYEAVGENDFITITKSAKQREISDVYIEDFKIQPYQAGGLYTLQVKIANAGPADVPWFRMNFYKGKPEDNINLFGKAMAGSYGAGPIKAGEYQNAVSQPFALDKGENEFTAVLDIENTIAESNENNNSASLKIFFENGKVKSEKETKVDEKASIGIITLPIGTKKTITAQYGSPVYGSNKEYSPLLYMGRVDNGDEIELLDNKVFFNQFAIPIIKVKVVTSSTIPSNTIGWITLADTSFAPNFKQKQQSELPETYIIAKREIELESFKDAAAAIQRNSRSPLHFAVMNNHQELAEMLISKGADVNAKDSDGNSPLHLAASNGNPNMCALLIEKGADLNMKNANGRTPLDLAAANGHRQTAELLIAKGAKITTDEHNSKKSQFDDLIDLPYKLGVVGRMLTVDEKDLIKGLQSFNELTGKYPSKLDSNTVIPELVEILKAKAAKGEIDSAKMNVQEKEKLRDNVMDVFFASVFWKTLESKQPYYMSSVTEADKDKVLASWQISKNKRRAIYGGLLAETIYHERE